MQQICGSSSAHKLHWIRRSFTPIGILCRFKAELLQGFLAADLVKSAGDRLDKLHQIRSVSCYVNEYRKSILLIPDLSEGYSVHRNGQVLRGAIHTEVDLSPRTNL